MIEYVKYILEAVGALAIIAVLIKKPWGGSTITGTTTPDTKPQTDKAGIHEGAGEAASDSANQHQQSGQNLTNQAGAMKDKGEALQTSIDNGKGQLNQPTRPVEVPSNGNQVNKELNDILNPNGQPVSIPETKNDQA